MTRPRRRRPERAALSIPPTLATLRQLLPEDERRVADVWDRAVGARVASRAQPRRLARGVLTVGVANSAWLNELSFLRQELALRLNQAVGADVVTDVRFVLSDGGGPPRAPMPRPARPPGPPADLTPFEADLASVADEELRAQIRRVLKAALSGR